MICVHERRLSTSQWSLLELKWRYSPRHSVRSHPEAMHGFPGQEQDAHTEVHENICFPVLGLGCGYYTLRWLQHRHSQAMWRFPGGAGVSSDMARIDMMGHCLPSLLCVMCHQG